MIIMKIANIVARAEISGFDSDAILDGISTAEYRPNGFPAICIGVQNRITISLFGSGKITSKGARSTDSAIQSINNFIKTIKKLGMRISVISAPSISLIVSRVSFGKRIDIKSLKSLSEFKGDVKRFSSIQLDFSNCVSVRAYDNSLVVSGKTISHMTHVVNILEKHTMVK